MSNVVNRVKKTILSETSKNATFSTDSMNIEYFTSLCLQVNVSDASSLNVSVKVQGSVDNSNFVDDSDLSAATITADGSVMFENGTASYPFVRLVFTFTAGSATFEVLGFAKRG